MQLQSSNASMDEIEILESLPENWQALKIICAARIKEMKRLINEDNNRSDILSMSMVQEEPGFDNSDLSGDLAMESSVHKSLLQDETFLPACFNSEDM